LNLERQDALESDFISSGFMVLPYDFKVVAREMVNIGSSVGGIGK
jgi:hypothetical protein